MAGAIPDVVIRLVADVDQFIRDWDRAADAAERAAARIAAAGAAAGNGPDGGGGADRYRDLDAELNRLTRTIRQTTDHIRDLGNASRSTADDVDHLGARARQAGDDLGNGGLGGGAMRSAGSMRVMLPAILAVGSILPAVAAAALAGGAALVGIGAAAGVAALGGRGLGQAFEHLSQTTQGLRRHLDSTFRAGLSQEMRLLGNAVSELEPEFQLVADAIVDLISGTTEWIRSAEGLDTIRTLLGGVEALVRELTPGVTALVQLFLEFGASAAPSMGKIGAAISDVLIGLRDVFREADQSGDLTKAFDAGATAIRGFGSILEGVVAILIEMASQGGEPAAQALIKIGEALKNAAPAIGAFFAELAKSAEAFATVIEFGSRLLKILDDIGATGSLTAPFSAFGPALGPAIAAGKQFADTAALVRKEWAPIAPVVGVVAKSTQQSLAQMAVQGIQKVIEMWTRIKQEFQQGPQQAIANVTAFVSRLVQSFQQMPAQAVQKIAQMWTNIKQSFQRGQQEVIQLAVGMFASLAQSFSEGVQNLVMYFQELPAKILETFAPMVGNMRQVGADIVNGLTEGLKSAASGFIAEATRIATEALATIKRTLGIASPSRVMADEVGRWIPAGIAQGIIGNAGVVTDAMRRVQPGAVTIAAGRAPAMARSGAGMGAGMGGQQTFTLQLGSGADSAMGTAISALARQGKLKITANAVVR